MLKRCLIVTVGICVSAASLFAQSNVVTFTPQDITGLMVAACGPQGVPTKKVHVHRNADGNMLYIVSEGQFEALLYGDQQTCNPLAPECIDIWRNAADGVVSAQLLHRYDGERLLVQGSTDGISGKHFDVSPGGQYMVVSHGDASSVSPLDRPYMRTVELQMDARRIFTRPGGFLVVGGNKTTNKLEAVPVSLQGGTATAGAPIIVPGVPAGVLVMDFNPATDELLLGGLDSTGVTSFALANLSTGQAKLVDNVKPGATTALFITDPSLYARVTGQPAPAGRNAAPTAPAAPSNSAKPKGKSALNPFGWFGRK